MFEQAPRPIPCFCGIAVRGPFWLNHQGSSRQARTPPMTEKARS